MVALGQYLALFAASANIIFAHPGQNVQQEIAQRSAYMAQAEHRSLDHCAAKLKERGFQARAIARRRAKVESLRKKRSLEARDFKSVLNTSHHSEKNYTSETPADVIFAGNKSCVLSPEVTEGPYCKCMLALLRNLGMTIIDVSGELVRQNVTESEPGVPLTFEVQVINVKTCEPLTDVLLEMWHCNSTVCFGRFQVQLLGV